MKNKHLKLSEKKRKVLYISSLVLFVAIMTVVALIIGKPLVKYAEDPIRFQEWLDSFGIYSRLVFIFVIFLQVIIAIIPGEPFELMAGYCFGAIEGCLLTMIGITFGCFIIFLLVKRYRESIVKVFFQEKEFKRLSFLKDPNKAKKFVFILNVIPGIPKDILSYFIGLTNIEIKSWLIIVFFGRIPSIITSTICGDLLAKKQYVSSQIAIVVTIVLSIIGIFIYNLILNKYNKKKKTV